jgi:serine/threonine protein kinase
MSVGKTEHRLGPFVLEQKIGAGAMGVVYRARYEATGQQVALKLLPAALADNQRQVARFERELEILKRLQHPHIVRCYGGGKLADQWFYAMELIPGGSLAALLARRGRLMWEQAIEFGLEICAALEHLHCHGIIHRDLKPSNLLLAKGGTLKLSDFGLARDIEATGLTAPGKTVGTFAYMAPEQITGQPISHKTDLYALGCVLFEMLTGRPPFVGETPAQIFYQHLEARPRRVATLALDCPVWLDALVAGLLEKDPQRRPMDALAVTQALREVEHNVSAEVSTVQHSLDGQPSAIAVSQDTIEARKLLAPKKRKRAKKTPIYERTWVLMSGLALLAAVVTWTFWPKSEQKLFARAETLMASSEPADWQTAREKYLEPLQRRFPDGQYAEQVQQYIDKIEMQETEAKFRVSRKLGRDPKSEAERLYAAALRFEQFGDRVTALERYRGMVNILGDRAEDRPWLNLARRQIAQIEAAGGDKDDRIQIVTAALDRADKAYEEGRTLDARETWNGIVTLYISNREMEPLVARAQTRLAGRNQPDPARAGPEPSGEPPNPDSGTP